MSLKEKNSKRGSIKKKGRDIRKTKSLKDLSQSQWYKRTAEGRTKKRAELNKEIYDYYKAGHTMKQTEEKFKRANKRVRNAIIEHAGKEHIRRSGRPEVPIELQKQRRKEWFAKQRKEKKRKKVFTEEKRNEMMGRFYPVDREMVKGYTRTIKVGGWDRKSRAKTDLKKLIENFEYPDKKVMWEEFIETFKIE